MSRFWARLVLDWETRRHDECLAKESANFS
jgi:hypothetical protein